jgi:hypothetical protein
MVPLMFPALRSSPTWPLLLAHRLPFVFCACWFGLAIDATGPTHPPGRAKSGKVARAREVAGAVLAPCPFSHQQWGVFGRACASGNLLDL